MCNKVTAHGICPRILLAILNFIFLLISIALFIGAAVLKWKVIHEIDFLREITDFKEFYMSEILDTSLTLLLCIAGIIIVIALIGLFGACCANKLLLFIYLVCMALIFLSHLGLFIAYLVKRSFFAEKAKELVNTGSNLLLSNTTTNIDKTMLCGIFKLTSTLFKCCGNNGPEDFQEHKFNHTDYHYVNITDICCDSDYVSYTNVSSGCASKVESFIDSSELIIFPNVGLLFFQGTILFLVLVLINNFNKVFKKNRPSDMYDNRGSLFLNTYRSQKRHYNNDY